MTSNLITHAAAALAGAVCAAAFSASAGGGVSDDALSAAIGTRSVVANVELGEKCPGMVCVRGGSAMIIGNTFGKDPVGRPTLGVIHADGSRSVWP